jgi:hypothetical protein
MRIAIPLLCLGLAGCAGLALPGGQPAPDGAAAPAAGSAPVVATGVAPARRPPAEAPEPEMPHPDRLQQARVDCWARVERQGRIRDIDRRVEFVDKCVADEMKTKR